MNKIIKDQIDKLKPSATLAINEESNKLKQGGKKIFRFGFGQSPFPVPDSIIFALKKMKLFLLLEIIFVRILKEQTI